MILFVFTRPILWWNNITHFWLSGLLSVLVPFLIVMIKVNKPDISKANENQIFLQINLYFYVPSNISRIWCDRKTAYQSYVAPVIYILPSMYILYFVKNDCKSEIYLILSYLLIETQTADASQTNLMDLSNALSFWILNSLKIFDALPFWILNSLKIAFALMIT